MTPITLKQLYKEHTSPHGTLPGYLIAQVTDYDFDKVIDLTTIAQVYKHDNFHEFINRLLEELSEKLHIDADTWAELYDALDESNKKLRLIYLDEDLYYITERIRNVSEVELMPENYTVAIAFIPNVAKEPVVVFSYPVTMFQSKREFTDFIQYEQQGYEATHINDYSYTLEVVFTDYKTKKQYQYFPLSDRLEAL